VPNLIPRLSRLKVDREAVLRVLGDEVKWGDRRRLKYVFGVP
jgi:hypothetical protein